MDGTIALPRRPAPPGRRSGSAPATDQGAISEDGLPGRPSKIVTAWKAILRSSPGFALEWLLAALCLSPLMLMPLARDQGHFAYAGQVILDGGLPYRDVFDQKGPATHYTFALALALFGQTTWGVRFLFYLLALATTRLAAALGERLAGPGARLACALAMALALVQGDEGIAWHTAQVEDLLLLLQLAAACLYASDLTTASRWRTALAAALLGSSCVYKPTAVVPALAALAVAGRSLVGNDRAARLPGRTWLAYSLAGFLLPSVAALGYLTACGALSDFWMVMVEFNSAYAELKNGLVKGLSMLVTRWGSLTVLASLGAVMARAPQANAADRLLWALTFANLATIIWQGKYWPYHWTPFIGCLAIFAGVGAARVATDLRERLSPFAPRKNALSRSERLPTVPASHTRRGHLVAGLALIALLLFAVPVDLKCLLGIWRDTAQLAAGRQTLEGFRAPYECGAVDADIHRQAADYIRARTLPDEKLLVWGYETVLNFLADRRAPTRFAVDRILCLNGFQRQTEWRAEFLAALGRTPPAYIVVVDHNGTGLWRESTDELRQFSEFHELLERDYVEETRFDRLRLFHRRVNVSRRNDHDGRK